MRQVRQNSAIVLVLDHQRFEKRQGLTISTRAVECLCGVKATGLVPGELSCNVFDRRPGTGVLVGVGRSQSHDRQQELARIRHRRGREPDGGQRGIEKRSHWTGGRKLLPAGHFQRRQLASEQPRPGHLPDRYIIVPRVELCRKGKRGLRLFGVSRKRQCDAAVELPDRVTRFGRRGLFQKRVRLLELTRRDRLEAGKEIVHWFGGACRCRHRGQYGQNSRKKQTGSEDTKDFHGHTSLVLDTVYVPPDRQKSDGPKGFCGQLHPLVLQESRDSILADPHRRSGRRGLSLRNAARTSRRQRSRDRRRHGFVAVARATEDLGILV